MQPSAAATSSVRSGSQVAPLLGGRGVLREGRSAEPDHVLGGIRSPHRSSAAPWPTATRRFCLSSDRRSHLPHLNQPFPNGARKLPRTVASETRTTSHRERSEGRPPRERGASAGGYSGTERALETERPFKHRLMVPQMVRWSQPPAGRSGHDLRDRELQDVGGAGGFQVGISVFTPRLSTTVSIANPPSESGETVGAFIDGTTASTCDSRSSPTLS